MSCVAVPWTQRIYTLELNWQLFQSKHWYLSVKQVL